MKNYTFLAIFSSIGRKMPKIKKDHFLMVFGLYLLLTPWPKILNKKNLRKILKGLLSSDVLKNNK